MGIVDNRVFRLTVGDTYIGREVASIDGISFESDISMSSVHAVLQVNSTDLQAQILDCGSKNGTFVNERQVNRERFLLHDGDIIRAGSSYLILRYEEFRMPDSECAGILGVSNAMKHVRGSILKISREDVPVLVIGEEGVGKQLVAHTIHNRSHYQRGNFMVLDCHALDEATLFGLINDSKKERGAIDSACRGTLLLDHISGLSIHLQSTLLRLLEGNGNLRIIATTELDISSSVASGSFRADLYERLSCISIYIIPLRERREDMLVILQQAIKGLCPPLSAELVGLLLTYQWPCNVRELLKVADHLRIHGPDAALFAWLRCIPSVEQLALMTPSMPATGVRSSSKPRPSLQDLLSALERHHGILSNIAEEFGCSRRQIRRFIEQFDIDLERFRKLPTDNEN